MEVVTVLSLLVAVNVWICAEKVAVYLWKLCSWSSGKIESYKKRRRSSPVEDED